MQPASSTLALSCATFCYLPRAKPVLFKEGWQKIFEMGDIREQVRDITRK